MSSARRETKRHIISIQTFVQNSELEETERNIFRKHVKDLTDSMYSIPFESNLQEIDARRRRIESDGDLQSIFYRFWLSLSYATNEAGYLSKEGYIRLYQTIHVALIGFSTLADMKDTIEQEHQFDMVKYGQLDELVFCDFLYDLIGEH